MLSVSPQLQAKGIGKKLMNAAEDYARAQKCNRIEMTVISVRTEFLEWYEGHGYKKTGATKPFHAGECEVTKQLLKFLVLEKFLCFD